MNEFKETIKFSIFSFITCFIVKYALNHFVFDLSMIFFSLLIAFFAGLGWHAGNYINIKKKK